MLNPGEVEDLLELAVLLHACEKQNYFQPKSSIAVYAQWNTWKS